MWREHPTKLVQKEEDRPTKPVEEEQISNSLIRVWEKEKEDKNETRYEKLYDFGLETEKQGFSH